MNKFATLSNVFTACAVVLCIALLPILVAHADDSYDLGGGYDGGSSYDLGGGYDGSSYDLGGGYSGSSYDLGGSSYDGSSYDLGGGYGGSSYDLSGGYSGSSYDLGGGYTGSSYDLGGGYSGSSYDLGGGYGGSSYDLGGGYTGSSYDLGGGYTGSSYDLGGGFSGSGSGTEYTYNGNCDSSCTGTEYTYNPTGTEYTYNGDCGSSCTGTEYTYNGGCGSSCSGTEYTYNGCNTCTTEGGTSYSTEYGSGTSYSTEYGNGSYGCGCARPFVIPTPTSYPIPPSYYPIPQPIPQPYPVPTPIPQPQPVPQPIIVPQQPNVITNNTCTNGSCNYTNNSVNNSGNTVTVLPIAQAPISYPAVYTPPIQNVSCTISAAPNQVPAGQYTFLQWQSNGAVSATLSGYGNVAPSGSLSIRPTGSQNYILTVYGQNGQSATCNTFVTIGQIAQYPSVTLSQIPYTGFDFGPVGDAMYWALLALFALASGYLLVYYKGGMAAFAHFAPRRAPIAPAPVAKVAAAPIVAPKVEAVAKPVASIAPTLPTFAAGMRPTSDSMRVSATADGTPRIVISRN